MRAVVYLLVAACLAASGLGNLRFSWEAAKYGQELYAIAFAISGFITLAVASACVRLAFDNSKPSPKARQDN